MSLFETVAFAEDAVATADAAAMQAAGPAAMITSLLPMVLIIVMLYFMMIRPQRKKEKALRAMIDALKVGDKVVTIGGICGKISKSKDNYVILETGNVGTPDEKSFIKMERDSIKSVESKQSN